MHPLLLAAMSGSVSLAEYSINNLTVITEDQGSGADACESGIRFNSDGTIDRKENNNINHGGPGVQYNQVSSATDWVTPNAVSAATHYIRAVQSSFTKNTFTPAVFDTLNGTMDSFITLGNGQSREWSLEGSTNSAGEGNITWVIDFDIAKDAGGTDIVASGTITLRCLPLGP